MHEVPRFLRFARALALVSGVTAPFSLGAGCTAGSGPLPIEDGGPSSGPEPPTGSAAAPEAGPVTGVQPGVEADGGYDGTPLGVVVSFDGGGSGGPQAIPELPESWT